MTQKNGGVRLLATEDLSRQNIHSQPLVGWKSTCLGEGGLYNPRGFAMLRVVVQKLLNGKLGDMYDQPMLVENNGSIAICRAGMKVGLVQVFRMVGERILEADTNYVERLNAEERWEELLASLGAWRWEVPRGIPPTDANLTDVVIGAAKLEALDEAGYQLTNAKVLGRVNPNPTFFAHAQYVVGARIASMGQKNPEDLEIIGKTQLFSPVQVREMVDRTDLDDGLTLAGLAVAGFHF